MTQVLLNNDEKSAKIICTFFGERRTIHNTPKNIIEFLKIVIENEINIDNGTPTDVIIVNNNCNNNFANEVLNSYHNTKTKNGKIIIETRENKGGSFGGYYDVFLKYKKDYNYWFFCEDDVLIFENGYIKNFIDFLNTDENIGFVALAPLSIDPSFPKHSGGGCGLTSTEKFLKSRSISEIEFFLTTTSSLNENYSHFEKYEVMFTNKFIQAGMDIQNHPNYSPYCSNYELHFGQNNNYKKIDNKKIIYKIGF